MEQIIRRLAAQNAIMLSRLTALEALVSTGRIPGVIDPSDPGPDGTLGGGRLGGSGIFGGFGGGFPIEWDPAPDELGKLSKVQLQSRLADIAFMRSKLDQLEKVVQEAASAAGR